MKEFRYTYSVMDAKTGIELCQMTTCTANRVKDNRDLDTIRLVRKQVVETVAKPRICEKYNISAKVFDSLVKSEGLNPLCNYTIQYIQCEIIKD